MLAIFGLLAAFVCLSSAHYVPSQTSEPSSPTLIPAGGETKAEFLSLLDALPTESLHSALHKTLDDYKHGVFQLDRVAYEKVHDQNPSLATRLISAAALEAVKLNIFKRQAANSSSPLPSSTPPAESSPTSSQEPSSTPSLTPTSSSSDKSVVQTMSSSATPAHSTSASITGSASPQSSKPASGGQATPTSSKLVATTNSRGSTFVTSTAPSVGPATSIFLQTTTLSNGDVVVVTSYEIVGATVSAASNGQTGKPTASNPSLQTGGAVPLYKPCNLAAVAVAGGALGLTCLL